MARRRSGGIGGLVVTVIIAIAIGVACIIGLPVLVAASAGGSTSTVTDPNSTNRTTGATVWDALRDLGDTLTRQEEEKDPNHTYFLGIKLWKKKAK